MVLRVKTTPTRLLTNSLYTLMDNTPLHSYSVVCTKMWIYHVLIVGNPFDNCLSFYVIEKLGRGFIKFPKTLTFVLAK